VSESIPATSGEALPAGQLSETLVAIERELKAIWAEPDGATGLSKVLASTLNLAVVAAGSQLDILREQTDALSETHAGRVFLVSSDGHIPPWAIEYEVSGVCRPSGGQAAPVCNDRVELRCGAMVSPRVPSVVGTLTLAELPLVVEVAKGAPRKLSDALVQVADRLITDSGHTPVTRIAEMVRAVSAPVCDRAFLRMFAWRELCARFFDDALPAASAVSRVQVARTPGGEDPAALMLGWLASRLGWELSGAREAGHAVRRDGGKVEIELVEEAVPNLPPGELIGVAMKADLEGDVLSLRCWRNDASSIVRWTRSGARVDEHEHALGARDETRVVAKALDGSDSDVVCREALLAAASWQAQHQT